ncbi:ATP-binding cassette sub- A member 5, partial [Blyttiomyces sp. JEL0837]
MKRKLSVAVAMIGDPVVLILDEPSSGMDAVSRREFWKVVGDSGKKKGRLTVFTTHMMDEADILADRKAILTKGHLRCVGTSIFLKARFNIGYHLHLGISTSPHSSNHHNTNPQTKFIQLVQKHIGINETKLLKDRVFVGRNQKDQQQQHNVVEITFDISTRFANKFPGLFEELDLMKKRGREGLEYYGLSTPTLEEVFLKSEDFGAVYSGGGGEGVGDGNGEEERIVVGEEDWEGIMDDAFSTLFEKPEYFTAIASLILVLVMPLVSIGILSIYQTYETVFQFYHILGCIFLPTYPLPAMLYFMTNMYLKARAKVIPPLTFWAYFKLDNHVLPPFLACFLHILVAAGLLSLPEVNLKSVQRWVGILAARFGFGWSKDGDDGDGDLRRPLLESDEAVDEDVRVEAERALSLSGTGAGEGTSGEGLICVQKLLKTFKVKRNQPAKSVFGAMFGKSFDEKAAVKNVSFAVDMGDVFVLLGPNGAGKSTLMRIVIGEILPDFGRVRLGHQASEKNGTDEENPGVASGVTGVSASGSSSSLSSFSVAPGGRAGNKGKTVGTFNGSGAVSAGSNVKVGYTPQEDALWPKLTIEEHLMLYTRLRGVDSKAGMERVKRLVKALDLEEHVKKNVEALSGGTKRKTSYLISLCGGVDVLFLDEPSAG